MWSLFAGVLLLQSLLCCLLAGGVSTLQGPPVGNTLSMTCKTRNGHKVYKCLDGKWAYQGGGSQMVDAGSHSYVGVYRETLNPVKKTISGWWELLNDGGDSAESGYQYSTVTGMVIETVATTGPKAATSSIYVATQHGNLGATSQISYIAILKRTGGNAPPHSLCKEGEVVEVPFAADFGFYTQDALPPSLPQSISTPLKSEQPLESFYAQGALRYKWTGKTWKPDGVSAKLYTVPGGPIVGQFSVLPKPDKLGGRLNWVLFNPNGFSVTGQAYSAPVVVSKDSIGWQLIKVTSSSGSQLVGPYTYVLMTSTRGGVEPSIKPTTKSTTENNTATGLVITSSFSCIFWIYTT